MAQHIGWNTWMQIALSGVIALETAAIGAVWYGGGLDKTISNHENRLNSLEAGQERSRNADNEQRATLSRAIDERNHLLEELERRVQDKSDQFNEKIASATATNQATRDMLMMLERRLEVIETERRNR